MIRTRTSVHVLGMAALALGLAPSLANATNLFQDSFAYPNGGLVGGIWGAHSGAGNKAVQVLNERVTIQQSGGSGEDVNRKFTTQPTNAVTYATFTLEVPTTAALGSGNDYFVHFRPADADSNNFVSRTFIGPPAGGGNYSLGIAAGSLTSTPNSAWPSDLSFNTIYRIVIAFDSNTGTSTLWVNPKDESSPSVTSTSGGLAGRALQSFALRQASPAGGASFNQILDEVSVGTSFADAFGVLVPASSTWSLVLLASLLALAGGVFALRRRAGVA